MQILLGSITVIAAIAALAVLLQWAIVLLAFIAWIPVGVCMVIEKIIGHPLVKLQHPRE